MIHGVERAFLFMGYSILLAHAAQMLLPPKKLPLNQAFGEDPEIWVSVGINELSDTHKRRNGNDDSSYKIATSSCFPIRKDNFDAMVGGLSELAHLIRYQLKDETMRKLVALEVAIFRQRDWEQDEGWTPALSLWLLLGGYAANRRENFLLFRICRSSLLLRSRRQGHRMPLTCIHCPARLVQPSDTQGYVGV